MPFSPPPPNFALDNQPGFPNGNFVPRIAPRPPACTDNNLGRLDSVAPGTVLVLDNDFMCESFGEGHGSAVTRAVRQNGFRGPIQQVPNMAGMGISTPDPLMEVHADPAKARQAFANAASRQVINHLNGDTNNLNTLATTGARNSVLNISAGTSKSDVVRTQVLRILEDPNAAQNAERAFGVNMERLRSEDPNISGPERQRLTQGLVDSANQGLDGNPNVATARQNYDLAVRRFEANRNSVVVATTNHNPISDNMPGVRYPNDYHRSFNINNDVTAVAAAPGHGQPASPRDTNRAIYGNGSVNSRFPIPTWASTEAPRLGTSYAAPETGAVMAELHRQNPNLSSSQIENLMRQRFTRNRDNRQELNTEAVRTFLQQSTH